jgi:hypothetical protein
MYKYHKQKLPNIAAEWLALLLHIPENSGSNFGPVAGYPD